MNESTPEAWLGQFLLILELQTQTRHYTIASAQGDEELKSQLTTVWSAASESAPHRLFDAQHADELKKGDWAAWWQAQGDLIRYSYSALALSLLGDRSHIAEVGAMYNQNINTRMREHAHYVLCYLLGKDWPAYQVTPGDIEKLTPA